jgi:hypothetical protein
MANYVDSVFREAGGGGGLNGIANDCKAPIPGLNNPPKTTLLAPFPLRVATWNGTLLWVGSWSHGRDTKIYSILEKTGQNQSSLFVSRRKKLLSLVLFGETTEEYSSF